MTSPLPAPAGFTVHPASPDRWEDLERLFGDEGAYKGCWCAFWRLRQKDFQAASDADRREVLCERVRACDPPPGLLAYRDGVPVAWVSVEPRDNFEALQYSPVYTAIDDVPVWHISCFFMDESVRGRGLMTDLLEAVKVHVHEYGGRAVEGYPEDPTEPSSSSTPGYQGYIPAFEAAGFEEVARLSNDRPVYRIDLHEGAVRA